MMVASSPMERLLRTLDKAASGLHNLQEKSKTQSASPAQYQKLLNALQQFNKQVPDAKTLKEKDLAPNKEMEASIEQALKESKLFKDTHFRRVPLKNVEETIVALFGNLEKEVKAFDRHLHKLSLWKDEYEQELKYKVTKSSRTKRA